MLNISAKVITYQLASLATKDSSPVVTVWSDALLVVDSLDRLLHRRLLFPTPWHFSRLILGPLITDFFVKLDPILFQALLGAILGRQAFGAAVRVVAELKTVVTKLGLRDKLVIFVC